MPEPARQCLSEAGLTSSPPSNAAISWWDDLAAAARGRLADYMAKVGREGERHSIAYEERRVGRKPYWQSIESNKSGFDLLSVTEINDEAELQIEVKASERPVPSASFHITRNEWEIATNASHYVFHLWSLITQQQLAVLSPAEIKDHIPIEQGRGQWETVVIPFSVFQSRFRPIIDTT